MLHKQTWTTTSEHKTAIFVQWTNGDLILLSLARCRFHSVFPTRSRSRDENFMHSQFPSFTLSRCSGLGTRWALGSLEMATFSLSSVFDLDVSCSSHEKWKKKRCQRENVGKGEKVVQQRSSLGVFFRWNFRESHQAAPRDSFFVSLLLFLLFRRKTFSAHKKTQFVSSSFLNLHPFPES